MISIIDNNIERARQSDNEFLILTICMSPTTLTSRHIIDPICTLYLKRNLLVVLSKRKITT